MLVFKGLQRELSQRFEDVVWDYLGMRHMVDESPISLERLRALGRRLRDHYLPSKQGISLETLPGLIDLTSDALYAFSLYRSAQLHADADRAPALVYRFGFDRHKDRTRVLGVPLGADVDLMFPAVFANEKSNLTQEEIVVSKKLLKFLTNYIALQDPTPEEEDLLDKVAWPAVKNGNFSFIDINLQGKISIASDFYRDRMDLWVSVFEELKSEVPTNTERNSSDKANQTKDEL